MHNKPDSPILTWNKDGQPVSSQFDDPYFSVENGLEETRYVFLRHNGLPERWQNWQGSFRIIETGFGTGLNFLATWYAFKNSAHSDTWLHFTSIEKFPLNIEQLKQALALWPELHELSAKLILDYPNLTRGFHTISWPEERVILTLVFDDIQQALPQLEAPVNAWFLDGFAPSKNPEMWSEGLFQQIRRLSSHQPTDKNIPACTVATFTAAGMVRRGLQGAGFKIRKVPGYGRKREMLAGDYFSTMGAENSQQRTQLPWLRFPTPVHSKTVHIAIVGAGLAGCTTARSLAERGFQVCLYDKTGIAAGASGNPQGGLYIKLAADDNTTHSSFYLQAYEVALQRVTQLLGESGSVASAEQPKHLTWSQCGVLQRHWNEKEKQRQSKYIQQVNPPASLVENKAEGLLFPKAGWVSPRHLCEALCQHPNIRFIKQEINQLEQLEAEAIVVANAYQAKQLLPDAYLPTKKIRGQLSYLEAHALPQLERVECARSYMPPPVNGQLCLGATYNLNDDETELRNSDHLTNLSHLQDFGDEWAQVANIQHVTGGRVGFRCTTPDYLPMVGPIVDTSLFIKRFASLKKNAKILPKHAMPYMQGVGSKQPNIYLNIGHGSRGLASAPLCAELLTSMISGDAIPISNQVLETLLPSRFLLRDLIRGKVQLNKI